MHVNWLMPLGGALRGTLPNPSLVSDELGLVLTQRIFGRAAVRPDDLAAGSGISLTRRAGQVEIASTAMAPDADQSVLSSRVFRQADSTTFAPVTSIDVTLDFGAGVGSYFVSSGAIISNKKFVGFSFKVTTDHASIEDVLLEELIVEIADVVPNVSFVVYAYAPNRTYGQYKISVELV